jgi:spermidine/putrescine transport system substrate-binding protein
MSRRQLLRRAGALATLPFGASLAAACADSTAINAGSTTAGGATTATGPTVPLGPGGIPLARRDAPVNLRKYSDVAEIASGLPPEKGPLKLYNWNDYIDPNLLKAFGKKYGVKVQLTTFTTMDEAMSKLSAGGLDFDVLVPTVNRLADLVSQDLLLPLNHDYVPNLAKNVWPQFTNPFYDFGAHYSVPYTLYSVGISWRNDKVKEDIAAMSNPWDALWNATAYKGRVALLDDNRDALGTAMLRRGVTDINTEDPTIIDQARADLQELVQSVDVKFTTNQFQDIPDGKLWLAHDWSGDIIGGALYYMPDGVKPDVLSYWRPPVAQLSNDTLAILAGGKNPVLAHLFLDFMLDADNAYSNMANFNGYQPPQNSLDPATLAAKLKLPKTLETAIVTQADFASGLAALALTPTGDAAWQAAWAQLKAG